MEEESQEDLSQQAQVPQCLKVASTPSSAERELHELTHLPFRSWCEVCQRAKELQGQHKHQSQKKSSVIQLDHSFYKVPGSIQNLKVLTSIETSTSMCGAVIVPDLSANQVGIKALKQFTMVNGFTHSVLQCDGHSGLMKLQDQVGKDLSLPTQISPPYSHQSQGTVERNFIRLCMVRSGQSNSDSLLIWGFIQIQQQLVSCPGSFLMLFHHQSLPHSSGW